MWWVPRRRGAVCSFSSHTLVPAALPSAVVSRPPGIRRVVTVGPIHHLLEGVPRRVVRGSSLVVLLPPVVLVLAPLRTTGSLTLAIAGIRLLLINSIYMVRTIPIIRPVLPPLVSKVRAIVPPGRSSSVVALKLLTRLHRVQQRLRGITQCITVRDPDCLSQGGRHLPLQLLPQHAAMSASLSKPCNGF